MKYFVWISALLTLASLGACSPMQRDRSKEESQVSGISIVQKVCSACHGATGESISPMFPKLAGQQHDYLQLQLADFKGHVRKDAVGTEYMWGFTHLTNQQIEEITNYFSSQLPMKAPTTSKAHVNERGQEIYLHGLAEKGVVQCVACHGDLAQGRNEFPRLAGQHTDYLIKQLSVFQNSDDRPRGQMMRAVAHQLSPQDKSDVAEYITNLGR